MTYRIFTVKAKIELVYGKCTDWYLPGKSQLNSSWHRFSRPFVGTEWRPCRRCSRQLRVRCSHLHSCDCSIYFRYTGQWGMMQDMLKYTRNYCKNLTFGHQENLLWWSENVNKVACIQKIQKEWQCRTWSDCSSSLIWVYTVCLDLSVRKFRIIMVVTTWERLSSKV